MFLLRRFLKSYLLALSALLLSAPAWATGPPAENPLYNPLALLLISVMFILLIVIAILANVLVGAADISLLRWKKNTPEKRSVVSQTAAILIGCMLMGSAIFAQDGSTKTTTQVVASIGGLSPSAFYIMVSFIFLELLIILGLLINVRLLLKSQKEKLTVTEIKEVRAKMKRISWWSRFNKFKPIDQEVDIDLGHEYDGIRELNNRLPPWWIYGFYLTIVFAVVYLWRYHVSHTAPLSKEEYEIAVQKADEKVKDYLKQKGDAIDENTVKILGETDVIEGKRMFQTSCVSCHNDGGAGNVGPNLTDDYWMHGGDIKSVFKTIKYGINAMPTWQNSYSNKQIAQLASYVKSLHGTNPANAKAPQGELYKDESTESKPESDSSVKKKEEKVAIK